MTSSGQQPPDVLFVGHEASRTGAPLMFLYLLRWLRDHTDLRFELVLLREGDLVDDYREVSPVTMVGGAVHGPNSPGIVKTPLPERLQRAPLVYCNSSASGPVLGMLDHSDRRVVVTHVHELEEGLTVGLPRWVLDLVLRESDHFVAASDLVKANLVHNHGVSPAAVVRHYEFIDIDALDGGDDGNGDDVAELRDAIGIPPDAAVVGAVGVRELRKGPDLFLAIASLLARRPHEPPAHFVWLGGSDDDPETRWLEAIIDRSGLRELVHLVPSVPRPRSWYRLFDVLALTSREDTFPLVCLESSLVGTPVVCFDNTGMCEFVGADEFGFVVPYLDLDAMAARVSSLLDDAELRRDVGRRAADQVREGFSIEARAPQLHADIERWRARA